MATDNIANIANGDDRKSRLLALPIELLHWITDYLHDESLSSLRLSCRAIEAATFDQFATRFFDQRYCFIYHKPRWDLLRNILASRLAGRIRKVTFTTQISEQPRLYPLQLAPRRAECIYKSACIARAQLFERSRLMSAVGLRSQLPAWPTRLSTQRCLLDLGEFAPNALVELDIVEFYPPESEEECVTARTEMVAAIVRARLTISELYLLASDIVVIS